VANWPDYRPTRLLKRLSDADVDFVVVGGVAVVAQGYPRLTNDLDICYATDQANLDRLGELLVAIEAKLRGVEEDVPFVPDGRALRKAQILTLSTREGELDLLVAPPGAPAYATLRRRADRIEVAGARVLIASIEDLLAMKRAGGRPQDLIDVEALEVALRRRR
jgi:predicted nucleotidyltransferase